MTIEYVGVKSGAGKLNSYIRLDSIPLAAGQSLMVFVALKHDGAARDVINMQWDSGGLNEDLSQILQYASPNNLRTEHWGKVTPTAMTANLRINFSAATHAYAAWAVRVTGIQSITPYHYGESEFAWVTDWPKNVTGIDATRFMFCTQNHIRSTGTWTPDEMTEVSELAVAGTTNQKSLRAALMYKQCNDADMQVGGNLSVERTGHLVRAAYAPVPAPAGGAQVIWMM